MRRIGVPESFRRAYRSAMCTKHVDTAADLPASGCRLRIECTGCGAARTMSAIEVVKRCGPGDLARLRARLKCGRCGMKEAQVVVLSPV